MRVGCTEKGSSRSRERQPRGDAEECFRSQSRWRSDQSRPEQESRDVAYRGVDGEMRHRAPPTLRPSTNGENGTDDERERLVITSFPSAVLLSAGRHAASVGGTTRRECVRMHSAFWAGAYAGYIVLAHFIVKVHRGRGEATRPSAPGGRSAPVCRRIADELNSGTHHPQMGTTKKCEANDLCMGRVGRENGTSVRWCNEGTNVHSGR